MFTAVDIVILILLGYGAYTGYKKGLLIEVISLLALVLALLSAFKLLHKGVEWLSVHYPNLGSFLPYLAFVGIFLVVFILIILLGRFLKRVIDMTLFGSFDGFAGGIIGVCKSAFLISVLIWLTHQANIDLPSGIVSQTYIYPYLITFAPSTIEVLGNILPLQDIFPSVKKLLQRS